MIISVLMLAFGIALGIAFIWDVGGMATKLREQEIGKGGISAALFTRAPWIPRAFGVWAIVFGIGQLLRAGELEDRRHSSTFTALRMATGTN